MTSSVKLSIMSYNALTTFNPADYDFDLPTINTKLSHLFVLSNTSSRSLSEQEKIQHLLTAYERIKQPEKWAQWVLAKMDHFDEGRLTNAQRFMNEGALKHLQISSHSDDGFGGSANTLQQDIVAMLAVKRKTTPPGGPNSKVPGTDKSDKTPIEPPFLRWFKSSAGAEGVPFKVGDTKSFQGKTWHYCDCPNHKGGARWHPHKTSACRTRQAWLKNKDANHNPTANLATDDENKPPTDDSSDAPDSSSDGTANPSDQVTALLAQALALSSGNEAVADYIHDALGAL